MTSLCDCGQYQPPLQRPAVDDVADEVDRVGVVEPQKVHEKLRLTASFAEVDVGDE